MEDDIHKLIGDTAPQIPRDLIAAARAGAVQAGFMITYHTLSAFSSIAPHEWTPQMRADLAELRDLADRLLESSAL